MKKWIWSFSIFLLFIGGATAYWGYKTYTSYLNPHPQPISIPKEQRFFQDDPSSLDWLNHDSNSKQQELAKGSSSGKFGNQDSNQLNDKSATGVPLVQHQQGTTVSSSSSEDPLQQIKNKYMLIFKQMEVTNEGELKDLIAEAKTDYLNMKSGKTNTSTMSLMSKYLTKSKDLEAQADEQFYNILGQMKQELQAKGLPTDMVNQAKVEYEERKKLQRAALIQKFMPNL